MGVLDDMTKGISGRKAEAAGPRLTPVGAENSPTKPSLGIPEVPAVFLTNEAVRDMAFKLREYVGTLLTIAQGLDELTQLSTVPSESKQVAVEAVKAAEQVADKKAAQQRQTRKQRETTTPETEAIIARIADLKTTAQSAAFLDSDDPAVDTVTTGAAEVSVAAGGWECPKHGGKFVRLTTSRQGRTYGICDEKSCENYEKEQK